jgi:hypothetical protein
MQQHAYMNPEDIPSEKSWSEKEKHCIILFIWDIKNIQIHKSKEQNANCQELVGGKTGIINHHVKNF